MGGYRLPIGGQRGVPKKERLRQPCPSQKAKRARHARRDPARQQRKIENPLQGRACLRGAKGPDGFVHSHHRLCASDRENRPRQSRLQHPTTAVPETHRRGIAPSPPPLPAKNVAEAPCLRQSPRRNRSTVQINRTEPFDGNVQVQAIALLVVYWCRRAS